MLRMHAGVIIVVFVLRVTIHASFHEMEHSMMITGALDDIVSENASLSFVVAFQRYDYFSPGVS